MNQILSFLSFFFCHHSHCHHHSLMKIEEKIKKKLKWDATHSTKKRNKMWTRWNDTIWYIERNEREKTVHNVEHICGKMYEYISELEMKGNFSAEHWQKRLAAELLCKDITSDWLQFQMHFLMNFFLYLLHARLHFRYTSHGKNDDLSQSLVN